MNASWKPTVGRRPPDTRLPWKLHAEIWVLLRIEAWAARRRRLNPLARWTLDWVDRVFEQLKSKQQH